MSNISRAAGSLAVGRRFPDITAAVVGRDRFDPFAVVRGAVGVRQDTVVGPEAIAAQMGDAALVEHAAAADVDPTPAPCGRAPRRPGANGLEHVEPGLRRQWMRGCADAVLRDDLRTHRKGPSGDAIAGARLAGEGAGKRSDGPGQQGEFGGRPAAAYGAARACASRAQRSAIGAAQRFSPRAASATAAASPSKRRDRSRPSPRPVRPRARPATAGHRR